MKKEATSHHMDGVYVLLLFAVFAGSILIVLLFGASAYEKLVERRLTISGQGYSIWRQR